MSIRAVSHGFTGTYDAKLPKSAGKFGLEETAETPESLVLRWMPWERVRAARLIDQFTAASLRHLRATVAAMLRRERAIAPRGARFKKWIQSSNPGVVAMLEPPSFAGDRLIVLVAQRRAARLVLALQAWRLEHRHLPDKLERLVLDGIALDPLSGEFFVYRPQGVTVPKRWRTPELVARSACHLGREGSLPTGQPFLFTSFGGPSLDDDSTSARGWFFPIP